LSLTTLKPKLAQLIKLFNNWEEYNRDGLGRRLVMLLSKKGVAPNQITLLGMVLVFLLWWGFVSRWSAMILLVIALIASLTDMFDGMLARATNRVTALGGVLDGIRDIFLFLIMIYGLVINRWLSPIWLIWLVVGIFTVEFMKVMEVVKRSWGANFLVSLKQRCRGGRKLSLDRAKFFFFLVGCLVLLVNRVVGSAVDWPAVIFFILAITSAILSVAGHAFIFNQESD
jgi:phosphatidylglycerophosphate synthase